MKKLNLLLVFVFCAAPGYLFGAERVFYEDFEATNFSDHFMERTYTTTYSEYWEEMKSAVSQSTDSYNGNYSMTADLFGSAAGRTIGKPGLRFGNTQNLDLSSEITGTKLYLRWQQKHQANAVWGGAQSKQIYLNYRDQGQFVVSLARRTGTSWLLSIHSQEPYAYTLTQYFPSPVHADGNWHTYEVFFDWTGQDNGGDCICEGSDCASTNGTGTFWFKIDGVTAYENNEVCYKRKAISGAPIRYVGWPSNKSGTGYSGTAYTWLDDLEMWDDLPGSSPVVTPPVVTDTPPVVTLTNPSSSTYTTADSTFVFSGNSSDDNGVTSVSWSNNRGGSGSAANDSGDWTSWSVSGITLADGENVITISAQDTAGKLSSDIITVTYTVSSALHPPQDFTREN